MRVISHRLAITLAVSALSVSAGLAATGPARAAQVSATPGWRLVKTFGACCASAAVQSVTATGAGNAWATGDWLPGNNTSGLLIAHWNGRSWQHLRPPAGFRPADNPNTAGTAVAALSASYAWVFVDRSVTTPPVTQRFALLWHNGRWRPIRLADGLVINSAAAFTRSNAWGFGYVQGTGTQVTAAAVHFNGQGWRTVAVPVLAQGTASPAPDNIWAVGPLASAVNQPFPRPYALAHWTGRWQTVPFPDLGLPSGQGVSDAAVVADGSQGAWVAGVTSSGGVLLHWTGSDWVNVKVPFQTFVLSLLSNDGHGGLWIGSGNSQGLQMLHYGKGQWSEMPVSIPQGDEAVVTAMQLIPRTRSVWASGYLEGGTGGDPLSAMFKYGP